MITRPSAHEQVIAKHRRHVELSPGVGEDVQRYALAVLDDVAIDLAALEADRLAALAPVTAASNELIALLPGTYYMDPPDGGDVPVIEQLRRMSKDARRYRFLRDQCNHNRDGGTAIVISSDMRPDIAIDAMQRPSREQGKDRDA